MCRLNQVTHTHTHTHRVHGREDLVDPVLGCVFLITEDHHLSHHLVDGIHYVHHLLPCYVAVMVVIIEPEGPCGEGGREAEEVRGVGSHLSGLNTS